MISAILVIRKLTYSSGMDNRMEGNMSYTDLYQKKLTTAEEAVKVVQSGDWVDYGWCTGTPDVLDAALAR